MASSDEVRKIRRQVAEEIVQAILTTVNNPDLPRPKVERGEYLNDLEWAIKVAREVGSQQEGSTSE